MDMMKKNIELHLEGNKAQAEHKLSHAKFAMKAMERILQTAKFTNHRELNNVYDELMAEMDSIKRALIDLKAAEHLIEALTEIKEA